MIPSSRWGSLDAGEAFDATRHDPRVGRPELRALALAVVIVAASAIGLGVFVTETTPGDTSGGATGVLRIFARTCTPTERPIRVQVYAVAQSGARGSVEDVTSIGTFLFELRPGNYEVATLGKTRLVAVNVDQLSTVTMGLTGVCRVV